MSVPFCQILSHFPVEAAAIAFGNVNDVSGAIQGLRQRLNESRSLLNLTEVRVTVEDAQPRKFLYIHVHTASRKAFENGK